jgi:hypothetical protein
MMRAGKVIKFSLSFTRAREKRKSNYHSLPFSHNFFYHFSIPFYVLVDGHKDYEFNNKIVITTATPRGGAVEFIETFKMQ